MDALPVELLRLIYDRCDAASVRTLRLVTPALADVGYDYLLPPRFFALPWRDDAARLRGLAGHDRLRWRIVSVVVDLSSFDAEAALREAAARSEDGFPPDPAEAALLPVWQRFASSAKRCSAIPPLHARDAADLTAMLRPLVRLRHLAVTFRHAPEHAGLSPSIMAGLRRDVNHDAAIKRLNLLMTALQRASAPASAAPRPALGHSARSSHGSRGDPFPLTPSSSSTYAFTSAPASAVASAAPSIVSTRTSSPVSSAVSSPSPSSPASPSALAAEDAHDAKDAPDHCQLTSFSIDRLPLELFRHQADRRLWFQCRDVFAGLTRLDLALDTHNMAFPSGKIKAANGLGYVLRMAPHLQSLSLVFQNYNHATCLFMLPLSELLGEASFWEGSPLRNNNGNDSNHSNGSSSSSSSSSNSSSRALDDERGFRFRSLTDLRLQGISCDESDLRCFLLRHAATLQRLRLGGSSNTHHAVGGLSSGIRLDNGSFRSLFRSLRGQLPRLQRMHLQGMFQCQTDLVLAAHAAGAGATADAPEAAPAQAQAPGARSLAETYFFDPTTDDDWNPLDLVDLGMGDQEFRGLPYSDRFEAYVLGKLDTYPGHAQLR